MGTFVAVLSAAMFLGFAPMGTGQSSAADPALPPTDDRECGMYWLEQYLHWQLVSQWELRLHGGTYQSDLTDLQAGMYAHNEAVRAWSYWRRCEGDEVEAARTIATYNDNRDLFAKLFRRYTRYPLALRDAARDVTYCSSCESIDSLEGLLRERDAVIVRGYVGETTPQLCDDYSGMCIDYVHTTVVVREMWLGVLPPNAEHDRISVVLYNTWWLSRRPWLEPGEEVILILRPSPLLLNPPNKYPLYRIIGERYGYFLLESDRLRHGVLQDPTDPAHRGHPDLRHPLAVFADSVDTSKLKAAFVGDG